MSAPNSLTHKKHSNKSIVLPSETRVICTFLNPSLLRVMNHSMLTPYMCTMGEGIPDDFAGVTKSNNPCHFYIAAIVLICIGTERDTGTERDLVAELSFRDAWDTEFANKWWGPYLWETRRKIMAEQLKEEMARRREWDVDSAPVFKQWINSRK